MAAWDFADMYTRSPRACGPRALGVYISKIPRSHGIKTHVVCRADQEAGVPHREYIDRKNENVIFTP